MLIGHDIEEGHDCPTCGVNSICTIEDGECENQGRCDDCIKADYVKYGIPKLDFWSQWSGSDELT